MKESWSFNNAGPEGLMIKEKGKDLRTEIDLLDP
jgi:hypothetical protein